MFPSMKLLQHICHADAGQLAAASPSQGGEQENFFNVSVSGSAVTHFW